MAASRKMPSYAEASAELEQILEKIEAGEVDVDEVVTLVRRGAELIRFCRERLDAARLEVGKVVADLDALEKEAPCEVGAQDGDADEAEEQDEDEAETEDRAGGKLPF
ncbi:MAG TPA: exodeoxyribonuclease VII small subunit [Planctomycetota bacterium]|nr:exodeoxyribonuclease VII small subunit [Planctomycetota bacterium]